MSGRHGMWYQGSDPSRSARRWRYTGMYDDRDDDMYDDDDDGSHDGSRGSGSKPAQSPDSTQQEASHAVGYTVIPPDQKKREKLRAQAERGMQMYERHKNRSTPQYLSYIGFAGGSQDSLTEARREQARTHAQHTKTSRLLKEQERRTKQRAEEEKVLEEKKAAARRQAERNEQRERERQEQWRDDMKRSNLAFLDRLQRR